MSVEVEPSTHLTFKGPFDKIVETTFTVTNSGPSAILFKVKTTAPKSYMVRPNSGRVNSGQSIDVQVCLQPMKNTPPDLKCKDKFLVQSLALTLEDESAPQADIWQGVDKSRVHEKKLKVLYELNDENQEPASALSQPSPMVSAETETLALSTSFSGKATEKEATEKVTSPSKSNAEEFNLNHSQESFESEKVNTVKTSEPKKEAEDASPHSASELAEAKEKIRNLEATLKQYESQLEAMKNENLLRQRKAATTTTPPQISQHQEKKIAANLALSSHSSKDFPPHIVLVIALVAFLIGVLWF